MILKYFSNTSIAVFCIIIAVIAACNKDPQIVPFTSPSPHTPPPGPAGMWIDNKEYFWGCPWKQDSSTYRMTVVTINLTDSALIKGIKVFAAISTDWDPFYQLPGTLNYYYTSAADTINLSYSVIPGNAQSPGKLTVVAKPSFSLSGAGDVMILYQ